MAATENALESLKNTYFRNGADIFDKADVFTVKENVSAMRKEFQDAGVARSGLKFIKDTKLFAVDLSAVSNEAADKVAMVMGRYGAGSPGETAWKAERSKDIALDETARRVAQSGIVREGKAIDKKTIAEGRVEQALMVAGLSEQVAAVSARQAVEKAENIENIGRDEVAASVQDVMADIDAVMGKHEALDVASRERVSEIESNRDHAMEEYAIKNGPKDHPVNFEFADDPMRTDGVFRAKISYENSPPAEYTFKFGHESAELVAVSETNPGELTLGRLTEAREMLATFYNGVDRNVTTNLDFGLNPQIPGSLIVNARSDGFAPEAWTVNFEDHATKIAGVQVNGKEVLPEALMLAGSERGETLSRVAARIGIPLEKPAQVVLTVPFSERDDFEARKRETGAVTRYSKDADSGYGSKGGWLLIKGDPADFSKWTGQDAYDRFTAGRVNNARTQSVVDDINRIVTGDKLVERFGHITKGVMMPANEQDREKFMVGYVGRDGRQRLGYNEATADELKKLALLTSKTYQDFDRRESIARLEVMVKNVPSWQKRYDALEGDHAARLEALLPRKAIDGKMGFMGLDHGSNRASWSIDGKEAGLPEQDKRTMLSMRRGFEVLRDRYEVVAKVPLEFTIQGVQLRPDAEKLSTKDIGADSSVKASVTVDTKSRLADRFKGGGMGR